MTILGIAGSLRRGSHNAQLLRAAAAALPPGAELDEWQELRQVPPFDQDEEDDPAPAVRELRAAIAGANAVLIATPEYNAGVPGVLKNAVDWASRPYPGNSLQGKPVAVIGASTGAFGAVWAQADLRRSLRHAGAHVLDDELPVATAHEAFAPDGSLRDPELAHRLEEVVSSLARVAAAPVELAA